MATVLAAQLAQIRAQSTNPLNLKAQKKAHSQSLLFEPPVAATQDFDTIYQICYEGFEELCRLDLSFNGFAVNIFGEQSKQEDRTQMTAAQNQQLDMAIEEFLGLVSGRLLLKPALKAVEWLVRRFRIHEHNTLCLVLSFLPFHTRPIFATLLSILPQKLPPTLKFLHPYIQSLANPPRHTIVYSASSSRPFFAAFSAYVFKSARLGYHHPALTSFWASITTEAVASMLDQARSARLESQKQNQEDVVLFLLPILNEGLLMENSPDLRVGCYMVLTVLASKADLDDGVLAVLMEAVTSEWTQTSHAGIICLSVLAQQRQASELPKRVFKSVIVLENLVDDLLTLREQYKVERLTLSIILGIINGLKRIRDESRLRLLRTLIESDLMDEASTAIALESVLSVAQKLPPEAEPNFDVQDSLTDLVLRLADSKAIGDLVQTAIKVSGLDIVQVRKRLHRASASSETTPDPTNEDVDMEDLGERARTEDFEVLTSRIPTRTAYEISFLSHSDSYVFDSLAHAFNAVCASSIDLERFSNLPVLRKPLAMSEPLFFSFFVRIWCGNVSAIARAAAIQIMAKTIAVVPLTADLQIVLPYLVFALADESAKVRRAAAELVLVLASAYARANGTDNDLADLPILGHEEIYGQGKESKGLSWLSVKETHKVLADLLVPGLEECLLDATHIDRLLSDNFNGLKHNTAENTIRKELKTSSRLAIFGSLCSHVVNTPLYVVKFRLLKILNTVPKVGSTSRTKLLLPLLSDVASKTPEEQEQLCRNGELDLSQLMDRVVSIVVATDREGMQILKTIIEVEDQSRSLKLRAAALRHLQSIWSSMKADLQASFARLLLEQAVGTPERLTGVDTGVEAMGMLRAVPLSAPILQSFVEGLPSISSNLQDKPSASKRRRTSHGQAEQIVNLEAEDLAPIVRKITVVLELLEEAKARKDPELLKGLFQVFSDLHHCSSHSSTATGYLQVSAMDNMLAIVKNAETASNLRVDRSAIRADVLVDCIRTTKSPQVRNTALLLVSALATAAPELVLHSVMPVFTFMGANVLHQDDDFSAYVMSKTMESVIPRLLESLHNRKEGPFAGVAELLLSFAAAFEHIPSQRRLDLFHSLADKVGPADYLFALLTILIDKYPNDYSAVQFAADLAGRYNIIIRLQTVAKYLQVILDIRKSKPTISAPLVIIDGHNTAENAVANLLPLVCVILSEAGLVSTAFSRFCQDDEYTVIMQTTYEQILEQAFMLAEQCKTHRELATLCLQLLNASLGLLPLSKLVGTLEALLNRTDGTIRRQVLRSFEAQLNDKKLDQRASQTACLGFLPRLVSIIEETLDVPLRHTAIVCVDRIVQMFGKKDPSAIVVAAHTICGTRCLGAAESSLRIISLLCLTTMIEATGDLFVSIIPKSFPLAIRNLVVSIGEDTEDKTLHNAVYSFLGALMMYLPWAIAGADLDRLLSVSHESANADMGDVCDQRRTEALELVPNQIGLKDCLAALDRTWPNAMREGPLAVKDHLRILRQAINRQPKSMIVKYSETLGGLFLKMFDLRHIQLSPPTEDSYSAKEIDEVEAEVNEAVIAMIYKLNDATFRPLFVRISDWTNATMSKKDGESKLHRQTTWYAFLLQFFQTLKSIVTSYVGLVIDDSVEILKTISTTDDASTELWRRVVVTLTKTFEHDQDDFYQAPAHFTPVCNALLDQLAHAARLPLLPELIPAIAELAVAADSSVHHKEMNSTILKYMRSDSTAVRLAAVQCESALTERLGEEWLALLPEMLPFISEALEDDDELVEQEVQKWVVRIENILGESLDPMLQ